MDEIKLGILPKNWNFIIGFKTTADSNYLCRSFAVLDYGTSLGLAKAVWAKDNMMYHHYYYWKAIDVSVDIVNKILVWLWSKPILVNLEPRALFWQGSLYVFSFNGNARLFIALLRLYSDPTFHSDRGVAPSLLSLSNIVQAQISTLELLWVHPKCHFRERADAKNPISWSDHKWKWREGFSLSH
jgi:hypothetical protein